MVTLEYDQTIINVPTGWEDVKLGHYETFVKDSRETPRDRVAYVAKMCNVDAEILLNWPSEIFERILNYTAFSSADNDALPSSVLIIGGATYVVAAEDKLSLGAYIDAEEIQKKGEAILTNLLAIVCRPPGEDYDPDLSDERAAMFADLAVSEVLGVLAFFLQFKTVLERYTVLFQGLTQLVALLPPTTKLLRKPTGGIRLFAIWRITQYSILTSLLRARLRKSYAS